MRIFRRICIPILFCAVREHANDHTTDSYKFPLEFLHSLRDPFPEGLRPLRDFPFTELSPVVVSLRFWERGEDDCVAFPRLFSSWRKLQAFPFVHRPLTSIDCTLHVYFQRSHVSHCEFLPVLLFEFFRFWPQRFGPCSFDPYVS